MHRPNDEVDLSEPEIGYEFEIEIVGDPHTGCRVLHFELRYRRGKRIGHYVRNRSRLGRRKGLGGAGTAIEANHLNKAPQMTHFDPIESRFGSFRIDFYIFELKRSFYTSKIE